ncbi:MAG TPA: AgmX/PglI C-terminal domain-containing protein [Myxococcota bacterium]|nr:AgmX/PglI C-terminal domain-containing protein [Myxococcota bacterium]HRY96493.1 AgmX/PglI C-terminal domain-containing protein [Myxococcota bacterium]HSA21826.1 AgmX/PglI C-terminal domain-containing protein [Myxococcota bacterium]
MKFRCESCGAQYAISDEKVGKRGVKVKCKKCGEVITVRPEVPAAAEAPLPQPSPEEQREPTAVDRSGVDAASRPSEPTPGEAGAGAGAGAGEEAGAGAASHHEEEELRSALDNILGDEAPGGGSEQAKQEEDDGDLDRASTRVFNVEEMQAVQAEREKAVQAPAAASDSFASLIDGARASGLAPAEPAAASADRERVEWYAAVDDQQVGPMSLEDFAGRVQRGELDRETLVWKSGFTDWLPAIEVPEVHALLAESGALQDEAPAADAAGGAGEEAEGWSPRASAGGWGEGDEAAEPDSRRAGEEQDAFGGGEDDGHTDQAWNDAGEPGDQETSSGASSQAFAGADVDWKPSAVSALSSLAEEELASLRPSDPEPEPKAEEEALLGADSSEDDAAGDMDDGDSSLIGQIAAEEEAKARQAEAQRQEEERAAELKRQREEEEAAAAHAAARRELEEERPRSIAPPPEPVPPRAVLPKWAIGLMAGGGLMLLVLVGLVGYILASSQKEPEAGRDQMQPLGPAERVTPPPAPAQPEPKPAPEVAVAPAPGEPGAAPPAAPAEGVGVQPTPGPNPVAVAGVQPAPVPGEPGTAKPAVPAPVKPPKPVPGKPVVRRTDPKPAPVREPPKGRDDFAEEDEPVRAKPEEPPKPVKASGKGLLDFEDEDDRALAADMGIKNTAKDAPKAEPKKTELPPLSNGDVLEVMKQHIEEFKACNKEQKKRDASVQGKMVVNFTIQPDGRVSTIGLDAKTAEFKGTFVADCISQTIKRIKFPAFGGGPKSVPFPFTVK